MISLLSRTVFQKEFQNSYKIILAIKIEKIIKGYKYWEIFFYMFMVRS